MSSWIMDLPNCLFLQEKCDNIHFNDGGAFWMTKYLKGMVSNFIEDEGGFRKNDLVMIELGVNDIASYNKLG